MKQPVACAHCGRLIRAVSTVGHPYRHLDTGLSTCADSPRATPPQQYRRAA